MAEHEGWRVRERIGAVLRTAADRAHPPAEVSAPAQPHLEQRVAHLEALVEGLQDSVHRDALRYDKRIADLERRLEPEELARVLSADARRRGL